MLNRFPLFLRQLYPAALPAHTKFFQAGKHLAIGDIVPVAVIVRYIENIAGTDDTGNDSIGCLANFFDYMFRPDGDSGDYFFRPAAPYRLDSGFHGITGSQTVIDNDYRATGNGKRQPVFMVEETAFLDIRPHLADLIVDLRLGKSCRFNHFLVENEMALIGQRTEPAFRQ